MSTQTRPVRVEQPPVDVFENADGFLMRADMPGVGTDALEVELDKGLLTVRGRRALKPGVEDGPYMEYRRRFHVPKDIDPAQVAARFERGVLEVRLPKSEATKPRKIQVVVG